ncbi:MAG: SRPBCC family protein [Candidatus Heimdallarchaeota archaeon]|nr:SRPBCC family protein [Candidatus Heimdallarchaeota archaeon]
MITEKVNQNLKNALTANFVFSGLSGIFLLIAGNQIKSEFGLDNNLLLTIVGGVLVIFSAQLYVFRAHPTRQSLMGWYASINDLGWVLGSILVLALQPVNISLMGNLIIIFVAFLVLTFVILQLNALAEETITHELVRELSIPVEDLWPIISDVDGYSQYATGLSSSKVIKGEGVGLVRRCYDLKKQGWNEECIQWKEGRSYTMNVDTSDYPYPFKKFQGTWSVTPVDGTKSLISLKYDYVAKYGIIGQLLMRRMFGKVADDTINDIIDAYAKKAEEIKVLA